MVWWFDLFHKYIKGNQESKNHGEQRNSPVIRAHTSKCRVCVVCWCVGGVGPPPPLTVSLKVLSSACRSETIACLAFWPLPVKKDLNHSLKNDNDWLVVVHCAFYTKLRVHSSVLLLSCLLCFWCLFCCWRFAGLLARWHTNSTTAGNLLSSVPAAFHHT